MTPDLRAADPVTSVDLRTGAVTRGPAPTGTSARPRSTGPAPDAPVPDRELTEVGDVPTLLLGDPAASGAVVLLHDVFGLTLQTARVAERLAGLGHQVAAPALFHRGRPLAVPYTQAATAAARARGLLLADVLADLEGVVAALRRDRVERRVAAVGHGLGGAFAVVASAVLQVDGAVAYSPLHVRPHADALEALRGGEPLRPACPVVVLLGRQDDVLTDDDRAWLETAARADLVRLERFSAGHAFTDDSRPHGYAAAAARTADRLTAEHLATVLRRRIRRP